MRFGCYKVWYARLGWSPVLASRSTRPERVRYWSEPRQAASPWGALVGWAAGSWAIGTLVRPLVGIPAGIFAVYRRYRGVFS